MNTLKLIGLCVSVTLLTSNAFAYETCSKRDLKRDGESCMFNLWSVEFNCNVSKNVERLGKCKMLHCSCRGGAFFAKWSCTKYLSNDSKECLSNYGN